MNAAFEKLLDQSNEIHIPLPLDERETADTRLKQKPVLESRVISDMESLDQWSPMTPYAKISLSDEQVYEGSHSVKLTHPTNLDDWPHSSRGRIYAEPGAMCKVAHEDWSEWNRLSVWVYPVADGMKSITVRLQLYNDGIRKAPDKYKRDGHHNVTVQNRQWNHIVLEIPYLDREDVVGVALEYDMVGHEPEAVDELTWYIDKLELQKVDADCYETWTPMKDRISYSGSGYQPGSVKIAIITDEGPKAFKLIETGTGRVALEKAIQDVDVPVGKMRVLDFTEAMEPGSYMLMAGDITSRVFAIDDNVWEESLWKTLNFFLVLRCGYEVPGKHRACHSDMLLKHGEESIVCNGGWHDAADLAQGLWNTAEATSALLALADALRGRNERLFKRALEEAKWGLDYVLKTRFSDGLRNGYSSSSIWTDGVIGTKDDIVSHPVKSAYVCFDCAYPEALGAQLFEGIDPDYAAYCLKIAREDFRFAEQFILERKAKAPGRVKRKGKIAEGHGEFFRGDYDDTQVSAVGAMAAAELFAATGESYYQERAVYHADNLIACQQQELTDWDVPMTGFFYQDLERDVIWHHSHMSYSCMPDIALRGMCEVFPDHPLYMKWYHALVLSGEYYKALARYTRPYGVIPAGVYHEDEMEQHPVKVLAGINQIDQEDHALYKTMVRKGFPVGKGYYIRVFPVWFSFRGNYNVLLSQSKSMSCAALIRNDYELYNASQDNYEWIVGKNPFAQSTMYGEGYDYAELYVVQPGQTVGALSVGMQSHFEEDIPYWPQVNTATYKEVWVCPPTKWMWCMADNHLPASLSGYLNDSIVSFIHKATGARKDVDLHPRTGYFETTLPAGRYAMTCGQVSRNLTVVSGNHYTFEDTLCGIETKVAQSGKDVAIELTVHASEPVTLLLRAFNLSGYPREIHVVPDSENCFKATVAATMDQPGVPWVGVIAPANNPTDAHEALDARFVPGGAQ